VPENTPEKTTVAHVHATDADAGENGHVTYRWADETANQYGSLFDIDAETGDVALKSTLDYELQHTYKVRLHLVSMATAIVKSHDVLCIPYRTVHI